MEVSKVVPDEICHRKNIGIVFIRFRLQDAKKKEFKIHFVDYSSLNRISLVCEPSLLGHGYMEFYFLGEIKYFCNVVSLNYPRLRFKSVGF